MDAAQREEFDELLAHTSRSFSLGIQGLSGEVRDAVTLAYLLCRIFDTYEDTVHVPAPLRLACLERSQKLLQSLPGGALEGLLEDWRTLHSMDDQWRKETHGDEWEYRLVEAGPKIWRATAALPVTARTSFTRALTDMIDGMSLEVRKRQLEGDRSPRSADETDRYCYSVAGTVGHLLTALFFEAGAFNAGIDLERTSQEGVAFGKALQLVNIMKDFHKDWREGRCYWPEIPLCNGAETSAPPIALLERVFDVLRARFDEHKQTALGYITRLNSARPDIRFFCEFPLRMAVATLDLAANERTWLREGGTFKVNRLKVAEILSACTQ